MLAIVLTGGLVLLVAVAVGVISVVFARTVVTPPRRRDEDTEVLDVDSAAGTVTLSATPDSIVPGRYSLWFGNDSGHARVGDILAETSTAVTRRLLTVDFGDLAGARRGRISGWFYLSPRELGLPFEDVEVQTELGPAPAWYIPAETRSNRWMIGVHGRAVRRAETLRGAPIFRDEGYNSLLISYRNDEEAPWSPDRRYALGDTEWRDVEAAMRYAVEHGATDIVLMGWSMGGATVLQAVTRSPFASFVRGLVLESPVVDWMTALRYQGELRRLPDPIRHVIFALIGGGWGGRLTGQDAAIDLPRLNFVRRADELTLPILLLHSDDDGFVPVTASLALAEARPDIVTFEEFAVARHTKLWNYDPERWTAAITDWLRRLPFEG